MGWQRSTLKLEFDDPEYAGLDVQTERFSIGDLLLLDEFNASKTNELLKDVCEMLARRIISWNFEDRHGNPVPITAEGVEAHIDGPLIQDLIVAVRLAGRGVSAPLETPSADGEQEDPIPMQVLPDSP